MSDLSGRLSGSQAISGSLSGGSVLRGGLSMGGGASPELLLDKADVITDTASGSIVSIPDGMASPVLGLDVDIEPIQDLHGYDNPWPAGGGKNLCPDKKYQKSAQTAYIGQDNDTDYPFAFKTGVTYTLSYLKNGGSGGYQLYLGQQGGSSPMIGTTNPISFTVPADGNYRLALSDGNGAPISAITKMQVEVGSSATVWVPYENLCPISGRSEVNVYVEESYDPQATPKVTIQLGQTVYGGTVDVTTGLMTFDKAILDLGDLTYTYDATYSRFRSSQVSNIKESGAGARSTYLLSSMFLGIYDGRGISLVPDNSVYCGGNNEKVIYIKTSLYTDKDIFKTFVTGQQLVYPIDPVSVQLAPTDVQILQHDNNIWADSGSTSIEYRADTKLWILKKIAQALNA